MLGLVIKNLKAPKAFCLCGWEVQMFTKQASKQRASTETSTRPRAYKALGIPQPGVIVTSSALLCSWGTYRPVIM
ncbi:hypothetical protein RRG08_000648 [Elysia crispata]|uniref:Uncharacterized protein n=1 Tax=Elysia crispata TaxID=231223 RepID=A0AAE0Y8H6_9GAST|nr:hypothetical protein RRG08_000648 [Elysia crispata]